MAEIDHQWNTRVDKALNERIYLTECSKIYSSSGNNFKFNVMGSRGISYKIKINDKIECSCPDHTNRHNICKHIMFVLIRMLKINSNHVFNHHHANNSLKVTSNTLLKCNEFIRNRELNENFDIFSSDVNDKNECIIQRTCLIRQNEEYMKSIKETQRPYLEDSCPICYEDFKDTLDEEIVWCVSQCGKSVHSNCFKMWCSRSLLGGACVYCRTPWHDV